MKRRIADWLVRFIVNNHTHHWEAYNPYNLNQKCAVCGTIKDHTGRIISRRV
jgi:hypothetical protein